MNLWFVAFQAEGARQIMGTSSKTLAEKLRKLAKRQHGCFTAAQAIEIGYADSVHLYHVKNGEWIRVYRGIYRLSDAPESPDARGMAALLWTRDKTGKIQGFLLPETEAAIRSGVFPASQPISIGVPRGFRRSSPPPDGIKVIKSDKHTTSNTSPVLVPFSIQRQAGFSKGMDMPDYYDWLDYHLVTCEKNQ